MNRLHTFFALCALALAVQLVPSMAAAQQQGTVYMNDGSVLTGQVIEFVPGDHITLQIGSSTPIVIPQGNISRVEMGQADPLATQPYSPQPIEVQTYGQPYQPQAQQPYQLQQPYTQPYAPPARRRPGLGLPITFLAVGAVLVISGGVLIATANADDYYDDYYGTDDSLRLPGIALAAAGSVFMGLGVLFLVVRIKQRRNWSREQQQGVQPQYGFAPVIAPEQSLYGVQGMLRF